MNIEYLVGMANDIGTFFDSDAGAQAPAGIADHIRRFWDPRMRTQIMAYVAEGGDGLRPSVLEAIRRLPPVTSR